MQLQRFHDDDGPDDEIEDLRGPDGLGRRTLLGAAIGGFALVTSGLVLPDWLVTETEAATSKHKKRRRRQRRRNRRRRAPQGTPGLAVDLIVENHLGQEVSVSARSTNTSYGNEGFEIRRALMNGEKYDFIGRHADTDASTVSRWEVIVEGLPTPVWLIVENPNLWPLNVSVAQGGWFHYDFTSKRFDYHIKHYLVDEKWLLVGGSFATTVADAHARVTIERTPDTATHMVVHARLDPA